jgi:phage recombination protein Bet
MIHPGPSLSARDVTYDARALALIKRTVAPDTTDDEFETFIAMCRGLRLDPRRRQIYALVYSKRNAEKRRMSIIVSIDGFRTVAARTGDYRPDDAEPVFEVDEKAVSDLNPAGLVKATVKVWKHSHGSWFPAVAAAYWSEFAPVEEEWAEDEKSGKRKPTGKKKLSGKWATMPRLMLAKVAEAQALRKAWPDNFSNVYEQSEVDRTTIELTATELMEEGAKQDRLEKIGGPGLVVDWCDGKPLSSVPIGQFADRVMEAIGKMEPGEVSVFADRNRITLREFWAHNAGDALELKRQIEEASREAE